jgi:hypothetical protein
MQQIPPNELFTIQVHRLGSAAIGVILIAQLYAAFINAPDTSIGDGDTMGITGQVVDNAVV